MNLPGHQSYVKDPDELCAHLLVLGIDAHMLPEEPNGHLGLIHLADKNIVAIAVVEESHGGGGPSGGPGTDPGYTTVHLEYRVRPGNMPRVLCSRIKLQKTPLRWKAGVSIMELPLSRNIITQVTDIRRKGGILADRLNGDVSLTESLVAELHENRDLAIRIEFDPNFGWKIVTRGVEKRRFWGRPLTGLPSRRLFDCLDRIAGHVIETAAGSA